MTARILLVTLIIIIGILVILPFVLNIAGFKIFQFGVSGGSFLGKGGSQYILRSEDSGATWSKIQFKRDRKTAIPSQILDIVFDIQNPQSVFLGTKGNGLWHSVDGGKTWEKVVDQMGALSPASDIYKIAQSKSNPAIIYMAAYFNQRGSVLKSVDGGKNFREIYFVPVNRFGIFDIYVHSFNPDRVFILTGQGGLLATEDGGARWRVKYWFPEPPANLFVNPASDGEMYVLSSRGRIFKTIDGGATWNEVVVREQTAETLRSSNSLRAPDSSLPQLFSSSTFFSTAPIVFFPDLNLFTTLYYSMARGLFRSKNSGVTWERMKLLVSSDEGVPTALAVRPDNSDILFLGISHDVHRTEDGGIHWSIKTISGSSAIRQLIIHPQQPDIMFAVINR